jgi:hypothetical protein
VSDSTNKKPARSDIKAETSAETQRAATQARVRAALKKGTEDFSKLQAASRYQAQLKSRLRFS